ncbi:low choriolytic enzyme-like isoform X2 [Hoplias malabaricus]|uniref:low choriolytic enzyme-like isoform X2 n=1 Tax=Hoplias malabaricus TaxID=27720 RepID=UPI0034629109
MRTSIMHLTLTLILLLQLGFSPAQSRYIKYEKLQATHKQSLDKQDISYREDDYSVSGLIERANRNSDIREDEVFVSDLIERANTNIETALHGSTIKFGDIAVSSGLRNADSCTSKNPGCKWPKQSDGNVYVPYIISNQYCG